MVALDTNPRKEQADGGASPVHNGGTNEKLKTELDRGSLYRWSVRAQNLP